MKLTLSPRAEKQLRKLPKVTQIVLAKNIRLLKNSQNIKKEKLKGLKNIYRLRVGNFRIVYRITVKEVYIVLIGHRKDVYKLLENILK